MTVRFYASMPHFADHLLPVWNAGGWTWMTDEMLRVHGANADDLYVVAAHDDMAKLRNKGAKRVILSEHGAGQSYNDSGRHTSYVGGKGRERCPLVLVPNEQAAARHRKFYLNRVPVEVVGCPKLDEWVSRPPKPRSDPPHVVITFHWRCEITREAGTVWDDYGWEAIMALRELRDAGEIDFSVHSHPRIAPEVENGLLEWPDIDFIHHFDQVVATADLLVFDNTSAGFEFAALDRPVVVLNSPRWRRKVTHGARFWEWSDVGPQVDGPSELPKAVLSALETPENGVERRREVVSEVFPHLGSATERAVVAIRQVEVENG